MLNKLKELIFGFGEFEKTKIEVRYELMNTIITSLKITNITDFELLEDCISKIKDQLRVRSSNLNKVISTPSKKLKKANVLDILEKLNKIKYNFLEKAFNLIEENNSTSTLNQLKDNALELDNKIEQLSQKEEQYNEQETQTQPEIKKTQTNNSQQTTSQTIFTNENYTAKLNNGKTPYLNLTFTKNIDYAILNKISSYLFEEYKAEGTNIIIENNKALLIPRFNNDNLINLPRIETNLNETFNKISKYNEIPKKENKQEQQQEPEPTQETPQTPTIQDAEYIELNEKPTQFKTKKHEEDSLDALLLNQEQKKITPKPKPQEDESTLTFEKDEEIQIEKEEPQIEEPEIEIEKKEPTPQPLEQTKKAPQENPQEEIKIEEQPQNQKKQIPTKQFEIYRDNKIVACLKENSKVIGELIIEPLQEQISETDHSYLFIFSKIFSSILFEITKSHGTNIIMDYSNNKIKIIPRLQEDQLNLTWTPRTDSDDFLDQIKNKLINAMQNALGDEQKEEQPPNPTQEENISADISPEKKDKTLKEKKADHLIEHLRKIP